jgi:hypothetical protein
LPAGAHLNVFIFSRNWSPHQSRLRRVAARAAWISEGSTLNPSPGKLLKERRDTAQGCRHRATADLLEAVTMATAHSRQMLERSAASWTARSEMLQRVEAGIAARLTPILLTPAEVAEDITHGRQ